jgi:Arc/MetJ-type ribon-helix-helix transcriptional regulator
MGFVQLLDELKRIIERQVAEGRIEDEAHFLEEAVRRFAAELDAEDEIIAVAHAGTADIEAGRFTTIATPEDADALHERTMARLRARLDADKG